MVSNSKKKNYLSALKFFHKISIEVEIKIIENIIQLLIDLSIQLYNIV